MLVFSSKVVLVLLLLAGVVVAFGGMIGLRWLFSLPARALHRLVLWREERAIAEERLRREKAEADKAEQARLNEQLWHPQSKNRST